MRCHLLDSITRRATKLFIAATLVVSAASLPAQSAPSSGLGYDARDEVTLHGSVSSVLDQGSKGMLMGSHLLIVTANGPVDASLGSWALRGKDALSLKPGQSVEVTGVLKTLPGNKQVFIARTVKAGNLTFTVRNEQGIPVSPQARERAARGTAQKGKLL